MADKTPFTSNSSRIEQILQISSPTVSESGPSSGPSRALHQQDDATLESSRPRTNKEGETVANSPPTKFSDKLAFSRLPPLQLPYKRRKLSLLEPALPSPMDRAEAEQLLPSPALLTPSSMAHAFPGSDDSYLQSYNHGGNITQLDGYQIAQTSGARAFNNVPLLSPSGHVGPLPLSSPMGTARYAASSPLFQPQNVYSPTGFTGMYMSRFNNSAMPMSHQSFDAKYETIPTAPSGDSGIASHQPRISNYFQSDTYAPKYVYDQNEFDDCRPVHGLPNTGLFHSDEHEQHIFPGSQDISFLDSGYSDGEAGAGLGISNTPYKQCSIVKTRTRQALNNNKNNIHSSASPSVTPPQRSRSSTGLHFTSFEDAEAKALNRKKPTIDTDDYKQVKANPFSYIHKLRDAFTAEYAQTPQGQQYTTKSDREAWTQYQDTHMERMSKYDEETIESACWMVLKNLIEAHKVGMKEMKYHKIESDITCSEHVDLIAQAIADYVVIRYDVVRLQRLDELICCTSSAVQRKLANFKGNKNKLQREIANQQKAEAEGFEYVSVLGNNTARSKKRKAMDDEDEDAGVLTSAPAPRAMKKIKAMKQSPSTGTAQGLYQYKTYESMPASAPGTKRVKGKRKVSSSTNFVIQDEEHELSAIDAGVGVGSSRSKVHGLEDTAAMMRGAAALSSMSNTRGRNRVFAGPDDAYD